MVCCMRGVLEFGVVCGGMLWCGGGVAMQCGMGRWWCGVIAIKKNNTNIIRAIITILT